MAANGGTDALTPAEFAKLRALPPKEALDYLAGRGALEVTFDWDALWQDEHARAFTISRLTRLDLLQAVQESVTRAVAGDLNRTDWMQQTEDLLRRAGWWGKKAVKGPDGVERFTTFDEARLKLILDTNTRQAYSAGLWQRVERAKHTHPYVRYITKRDGRVRPLHASWDNVTLPADDPFWQTHWPPNGWRCRCRVMSMTAAEYERGRAPGGGLLKKQRPEVLDQTFVNKTTGEISKVPAGIDPGFGYNPGKARQSALDKLVAEKLAAAPPQLAEAAKNAGLHAGPRTSLPGRSARLAVWTHPGSGQVRVYVDNLAGQDRDTKIWFEEQAKDAFGSTIKLRASSRSRTRGEIGNLQNDAESFLTELAGERLKDWAALLKLLEG